MKKFLTAILLFLVPCSLFLTGCGGGENSASKAIRFGTGGTGGMYYAYGTALAKTIDAEGKGHALDVKMTAGSAANLRLLREKFLDIAIVQSDTLSNAINGRGVFAAAGPGVGYAAVAGLYTEACQIVVSKNSGITNVSDLVGKRVSVGERESGVLQNAEQILMAHGLTFEMIEPIYMSFTDSASAMEKGQIDAFFITAGAPTAAITDLATKKEIKILSIEPDVQNNMMKLYKGYTRCTIPANTYAGQTEPVQTVGVKAVLVASTDLKDDEVLFLTEFIFKNAENLPHNASDKLTVNYAIQDIPASFHAGAAKFYDMQGVKVNVYSGKSSESVKASQD
ncbi:MAG: TAXI family TRAP transporter solute-binding subunit [Selenomonadaceae bacterium]|nr:TAXI family TRAP transporter solute-binding subunit [Selenomonadaceae bacterium]